MNGWVITEDHISYPERGRIGYGEFGRGIEANLDPRVVGDPVKFRLYDDDHELYYEGVICREWLDGDEFRAFAPLDFGSADAGATIMKYYERGVWKTL